MIERDLARYSKEVESYLTASSCLGMASLDSNLNISVSNAGFSRLFNLRQAPIGEPLTDYLELNTDDINCGEEIELLCTIKSGAAGAVSCHFIQKESGYLLFCEKKLQMESHALEQISNINDKLVNSQRES